MERSIPHLKDIFWNRGNSDVNELSHQFQRDARISSGGGSRDADSSKQSADLGNDSAISVGSTSEDEVPASTNNKKKSKRSRRDNNGCTITERDVKHLERHLSMKKTIRKKIMRDLQQAFVEDPNEFRVEDISHEQLKAEISAQSLSFGAPGRGHKASRQAKKESTFLDMLRSHGSASAGSPAAAVPPVDPTRGSDQELPPYEDQDSGHGSPRGSPTRQLTDPQDGDDCEENLKSGKKTSFWRRFTMKGRNKR